MGRWSKNRKAVSQIIVMTKDGDPALIFELENGRIKTGGSKILGTPGYGQMNNNATKNRAEKSSKRGRQNYSTHLDTYNNNSQPQSTLKTNIRQELDQSIKALQANQQNETTFNRSSKNYISAQNIPPARSIYSPPPPLNSPEEKNIHFTLSTIQSLTQVNKDQINDYTKSNNDIVVSIQDAELEPIPFYAEDTVFDFEFLKQDDFLPMTDMRPTFFNEIDPLSGSLPEIDYI